MITTTYYYPVFSNHLQDRFGLSIEVASMFFNIDMIFYLIAIQNLNKIQNLFGFKLTLVIGLFFCFVGCPLISPINILPQ